MIKFPLNFSDADQLIVINFGTVNYTQISHLPEHKSNWQKLMDSSSRGWLSLISLVTMVIAKEKFRIQLWHVCFGRRQVSLVDSPLADQVPLINTFDLTAIFSFVSSICSSNLIPTVPMANQIDGVTFMPETVYEFRHNFSVDPFEKFTIPSFSRGVSIVYTDRFHQSLAITWLSPSSKK